MSKKIEKDTTAVKRTYLLLEKALFDLLVRKPFEKITLKELCDYAMIPRSTFYRYFEDKNDLLRYSIIKFIDVVQKNEGVTFFKDFYSVKKFLYALIHMINQKKNQYSHMYHTNKNGVLMDYLKQFLTDILSAKLKELEDKGIRLNISPSVFIYLLTDFYFSAAKGYLELPDLNSVEKYVDDVCMFSNKKLFV